jgi:hypothetical protein
MFKKLFAALTLLIALPAFANAAVWTVKATSANPTFGTVSPAGYTNNADTTLSQSITVTPGANYQISSIMVDNVNKGTTSPVVVPKKAGTTIVVANFAAKGFTVKAGVCTNGSISSTGAQTVNAGGSKTFTVTPFNGYKILTVADNGTPVTLDANSAYTVSNVQDNHTITATFGGVTANAGLNQTAVVGGTVALNGSGTVPPGDTASYQWTVTYAPVGSATTTATVFSTAAASFVADKAGTYNLKLKVTDGALSATSTVAVTAFASVADAALFSANACISCHADRGVYLTSPHSVNTNPSFATASTAVACNTCHTDGIKLGMDAPVPTAATTCQVCHAASAQFAAWTDSSHNIANNGFKAVTCVECHDSHSTVATATDGKTDSCSKCHVRYTTAQNYGLYSSNGTMRTPHGQGVPAYMGSTGGANDNATKTTWGAAQTSYLTRGAICTDCHGHNNTINKGFAEGGHGEVSSDPMNPFNHYDWSKQTNNGTRQNGNCDRCHTAGGFMKFLGATSDPAYGRLNAALTAFASYTSTKVTKYQANNVLICVGCHSNLDNGALRTAATPSGNNAAGTGAGQALTSGYFALFSSSKSYSTTPGIGTVIGAAELDKTKIQVAFPGMKNSSICVPCHAGRSTDKVFKTVIARASADLKNYSTVPTSYYQHAKNIGQTFTSQGAYDFTGKLAAITANGPSAHIAVKNGATDDQGPCVGCHYSTTTATHSLEVNTASPTCIAAACHATAPDVAAAKANFDAGVAALDALIRTKFNPLRIDTTLDLTTERANIRFGRFGKAAGVAADAATATAAYGAWYNWQTLAIYDNAAYVHNPRYARQILNDTLGYLQTGVVKTSYAGSDVAAAIAAGQAAGTITADQATAAQSFITAPGCAACHADKVTTFTTAGGYHFVTKQYSCNNCHTELHQNTAAATQPTCRCHGDVAGTATPVQDALNAPGAVCASCHGSTDVHSMKAPTNQSCVSCHSLGISHPGKVADNNNGVRAITGASGEFGANTNKKSHHIVNSDGSDPRDEQCLACHAEGTVVAGAVVIDTKIHMKNTSVYLRNGGGIPATQLAKEIGGNKSTTIAGISGNVSVFAWTPSAPDHNLMDQFCFSCHNANGAPNAVGLVAGNTATNPFADTISNGYDQMARGKVVNAFGQFSTGNASHHAVRGKRYSGRTRTAGDPRIITAVDPDSTPGSHLGFANNSSATITGPVADGGKDDRTLTGIRRTLFDAGLFTTTYVPLGTTNDLGDDSTLHCGDCHTVGQWTNTNTTFNKAAIGAHGSVNEYLLRNSKGTDELHINGGVGNFAVGQDMTTVASLVCFNCHVYSKYGAAGKHEGVNNGGDCNDDKWTFTSAGKIGSLRLNRTGDPATWGNGAGGNMFGIQCANCHNSGPDAQFGGIHGGNITYTDGTNTTQKPYRFMPGLGNVKYAPNNHLSNAAGKPHAGQNTPEVTNTWEEKTLLTTSRATCYTLNNTSTAPAYGMKNGASDSFAPGQPVIGTWGGCTDHGGTTTAGGHNGPRTIQRPLTY